jgi:hypothetical protein
MEPWKALAMASELERELQDRTDASAAAAAREVPINVRAGAQKEPAPLDFETEAADPQNIYSKTLIGDAWLAVFAFVIIQLCFATGVVVSAGAQVGENWKSVLIALAGLSLGFGAAVLLYGRRSYSQQHELQQEYWALRRRADTLLERLVEFEGKQASHAGERVGGMPG